MQAVIPPLVAEIVRLWHEGEALVAQISMEHALDHDALRKLLDRRAEIWKRLSPAQRGMAVMLIDAEHLPE